MRAVTKARVYVDPAGSTRISFMIPNPDIQVLAVNMAVQAIQVSDSIVSGLEYRFASNCLRVVLESSVYTGVGINTHHESLYNHSLVSPARAALPLLRLL